MEGSRHIELWNEARALVGLSSYEKTAQVGESVSLALAYDTITSHPHPEVEYREQIAIFKRKVDKVLEDRGTAILNGRREAHVFPMDEYEPAERPFDSDRFRPEDIHG